MRFATIVLLLLLLGVPANASASQGVGGVGEASAATTVQGEASQGVPEVVILPPTATTRTYVHVFLSFAIAFGLLGGYIYFVARRFSTLEEDLARRGD